MLLNKLKQRFLRTLGNLLIVSLLNLLCRTLRIVYVNKTRLIEMQKSGQNYVFAFWHGKMLVPWFTHKSTKVSALVSKSKDGDILTKLLKSWKYNTVRGSSNDGGKIALGILIDFAKNGYIVGITPDGPKGPSKIFKAGAVITAKKSGIPLVLTKVEYNKKYTLKSWDKFEIPKPFSKVTVTFSEPWVIDQNLTYEETNAVINKAENWLNN